MKLFQHELSDWESAGVNLYRWNWWRKADLYLCVGIVINDSNLFKTNPEKCHWTVYWERKPINTDAIAKLYYQFYGHQKYSFHELEMVKSQIDNFIVRIDSLKAFI